MRINTKSRTVGTHSAFMLTEAMMSLGIAGVALVSLYAGISQTFSTVQKTREDLRVTQILVEKMESLRLVTWDQLNTPGFIPSTFRESLNGQLLTSTPPVSGTKSGADASTSQGTEPAGDVCVGRVKIDLVGVPAAYTGHMRHVTISVTWRHGDVVREQKMETFVSQYGIQNYMF